MLALPDSQKTRKDFLRGLPKNPGIYKFICQKGSTLYIGKAKSIKGRVASYFRNSNKSQKLQSLIRESSFLDITLTGTELEALLLEQHLIKEVKPKFNVQFKDDKGYPWIKIEISKEFPTAKSFLGKKVANKGFYGPYPSSYAVKDALSLIQKTFKLRNCTDSFFKNRTRPCLQHQIGRCSAPCVGLISKHEYEDDVKATIMLLEGRSEDLISSFYSSMDSYSQKKSYERAAIYRDKISALRDIQRTQSISGFKEERDAISINSCGGITKVGVTHVVKGWITGHENFIQKTHGLEESILGTFIKVHYLSKNYCPKTIVLEEVLVDKSTIEQALSKYHNKPIKIITKPGKKDKGLLDITRFNTRLASQRSSKGAKDISLILDSLKDQMGLGSDLKIIESYDISHHSGSEAIGGCVVYSKLGKLKDSYRLFNISKANAGNDIGSMKEVIKRRFSNENISLKKPSLILIDGGRTHLLSVKSVLEELGISDIELLSISKGARRKATMDSIHTIDGSVKRMIHGSSAHLFLQEVRDETHRFSISNQKKKLAKVFMKSTLDDISGIGSSKRKLLLRYFGSLEQIERASIQDFQKVTGIGHKLANLIYNHFH